MYDKYSFSVTDAPFFFMWKLQCIQENIYGVLMAAFLIIMKNKKQ